MSDEIEMIFWGDKPFEPGYLRRQITEQVASLLPGQRVIALPSPKEPERTLLLVPFVCPDCKKEIAIRLHLQTVELPLMLEHPRILAEYLEHQIIKLHP
jgi:hypothetical protein